MPLFVEQILAQRLGSWGSEKMFNVAPSVAIDNGLGEVAANVFTRSLYPISQQDFLRLRCDLTASQFNAKIRWVIFGNEFMQN